MTGDHQQLTLLLSRLLWPSGMVRERACDAMAELITNDEPSSVATSALLDWMAAQNLESVAATGLLILLRAQARNPDWESPSAQEAASSLKKPSLLSDLLMAEVYGGSAGPTDLQECHSGSVPEDYEPDAFFTKYATAFLPPIYATWADSITQRYQAPFSQQWAYEWSALVVATGVRKSDGPLHFRGMQHSDHYVAFDTLMSEVYRSAFLRALAWAAHRSVLPVEEAKHLAMKACQLDLGLWLVDPVTRPAWWPTATEPEGEIDTVPAQMWQNVERLWNAEQETFGDKVLVQAVGRVRENKTIYDLEILGAFQRCEGSASPNAEELARWYTERPYLNYEPRGLPFAGTVMGQDATSFGKQIGDWLVVPAARAIHPVSIPRWEYWKEYRGIWIPLPYLDMRFSCSSSGVSYCNGDSEIAKWQIWTDGLREKEPGMISPAVGQLLVAERKIICGLAAELGCVFCWICRLTGHHREYDHQEWKEFADCRLFGTTSIVMPFA